MSNTQIKARSGSDWIETELTAFNIQVDTVVAPAFFNTTQLPDNHVSPVIIATERLPQRTLAKSDRLFFQHMEDAMSGEDSAVVDFVAILLGMLQYDEEPYRIIRKWKESSFAMCGITVDAKPSVCVLTGDSEYLLLVQEAKARLLCLCHFLLLIRSYRAVPSTRIASHSLLPGPLQPFITITYAAKQPACRL